MTLSTIRPENFETIDHLCRFTRMVLFQSFINSCYFVEEIYREFIEVSKMAYMYDADEDFSPFDYSRMKLFKYDLYESKQIWFEPHLSIFDLWVIIPCNVNSSHRGVDNRMVDHLMGIGDCLDCLDNRFSFMYPRE